MLDMKFLRQNPEAVKENIRKKFQEDKLPLVDEVLEMDKAYPQYKFCQHKGYPTKLHYDMIAMHGVCPIHRRSFLKKILGEKA